MRLDGKPAPAYAMSGYAKPTMTKLYKLGLVTRELSEAWSWSSAMRPRFYRYAATPAGVELIVQHRAAKAAAFERLMAGA